MSSFCVFGITFDECKKRAEKKTGTWHSKEKRPLTMSEYAEKVNALAAELFEKATRAKQVSPAFDAPQFANDWIGVAERTAVARNLKIMTRGEKKDQKGAPLLRKGKPVIGWVPYAA